MKREGQTNGCHLHPGSALGCMRCLLADREPAMRTAREEGRAEAFEILGSRAEVLESNWATVRNGLCEILATNLDTPAALVRAVADELDDQATRIHELDDANEKVRSEIVVWRTSNGQVRAQIERERRVILAEKRNRQIGDLEVNIPQIGAVYHNF